MLILTRRLGERVFADHADGTRIVVIVTRIGSGQVKIGFEAPTQIKIAREEIFGKPRGATRRGSPAGVDDVS